MGQQMQKLERRYIKNSELEVRQSDDGDTLVGYAIRFNSLSTDLGGFRERIAKDAFTESLKSDPDVRAMVSHDPSKVIGRTKAGTLRLSEDSDGVRSVIDVPDTAVGRDVITSVKRGDLSNMSFGFTVRDDSWETLDGESVRTINKADLFDVSVVAYPAYVDSTVAVRSMDRWKNKENKKMTDKKIEPEIKKTDEEITKEPERRSDPVANEQATIDISEWRDSRGKVINVMKRDQRFTDLYKTKESLSMGRAIRAMIVGDWSQAPAEHRALSTTSNPTAGILVPEDMSATVIDKARAASVLVRAGAITVPMDSSTLKIARITTDATISTHTENEAFSHTDVVFDGVEITSYTLGCLVEMSRELAADAPNAPQIIEDNIAKSLAAQIDNLGLNGTGSGQPLGLLNFSGVNTNTVGTMDFDEMLQSVLQVEEADYEPNALILSPASWNVLRLLKVNSEANHYAVAPPAIAALNMLSTTAIADTAGVTGDFTRFMIGLRQSPMIEVTTTGGASFAQHSVFIKLTWRGGFAATDATAFTVMDSI